MSTVQRWPKGEAVYENGRGEIVHVVHCLILQAKILILLQKCSYQCHHDSKLNWQTS